MPIEGFNYVEFANNLAHDAEQVLNQPENAAPDTLTDTDKKNIVTTVQNLCKMAGEALCNDANLKFTAEQAALIVQCIGEWTFHKSIDFINGQIPEQYRGTILNSIVSSMFQAMKLAIIKNMPGDMLIRLAEENVNNTYKDQLEKLVQRGVISQQHCDAALSMSNLDNMAQKNEDQQNLEKVQNVNPNYASQSDKKVLKFVALAVLLKHLPQEKAHAILNSLDPNDVKHVLNYMNMTGIEDKIDHYVLIKSLEEIKQILPQPDTVNVEKLLKRHHKNLKISPPDLLSEVALDERENVKGFILDRRFPAVSTFSPLVIQSLVNIIEEKLNDN